MKSIDKQVKNSLDKIEFPYDVSHWEQAQRYILDRERRKRRILLLWWALGIAVVASLFVLITEYQNENVRNPLAGQIESTENPSVIVKEAGQDIRFIEADSKSGHSDSHSHGKNYNQAANFPDGPENNKQLNKSEQPEAITGTKSSIPYKLADSDGKDQKSENISVQIHESGQELVSNIQNLSQGSDPGVERLAMLNPQVDILDESEELQILTRESVHIARLISPGWKTSVLTEISVLTNVPGRTKEKAILGAQIGAGVRIHRGTGFFAGVNLGYTLRTGTFGNMLDHPTPEYVFEKKEEGYRLVPSSLSYIHGQFYAGYQAGKWSGKIGIQPMYLVAATGTLNQYSEEVSVNDPGMIISRVSQLSRGNISTPAFRTWTLDIQGGIEYAFSSRWHASLQFSYTPQGLTYPLVSSTFDPLVGAYLETSGTSVLKEQFVHFQLGIQYIW